VQARRQDVRKLRYRDWNELVADANCAAAPYGGIAVEMFALDKAARPAAEALSCAILMLTLLRNCGAHYRMHGRVYLPERWLREAGVAMEALGAAAADAAVRQAFAKMLDATDRLLLAAHPLPRLIDNVRARAASAALLCWADRLARRLRQGDPLAARDLHDARRPHRRAMARTLAYDLALAGILRDRDTPSGVSGRATSTGDCFRPARSCLRNGHCSHYVSAISCVVALIAY
jgi:phytoene/squalene synthetase